jgi:hypothetical protein
VRMANPVVILALKNLLLSILFFAISAAVS